jgi:hypothetical protein
MRLPRRTKEQVQADRATRVEARRLQTERLVSWLQFLRDPSELGIGDTAHRMHGQSRDGSTAQALLSRLLHQCSCNKKEAIENLNKKWPY